MASKDRHIQFTVSEKEANLRIDKALSFLPDIGSRSQAAKLIELGSVLFQGSPVKASYQTHLGDVFEIQLPEIKVEHLVPYDFPLNIVYEDKEIIVVDKPAGLVVHPACGHEQDTLVNALLHHTTDLSLGFNEKRPGIVHRIDKGTSGLLVVAKNDEAQRFLARQFQKKTTHRIYRAVVYGFFKNKTGTIKSFLKRHPEDRKRVASVPENADGENEGKLAVTHYTVLKEHASGLSLVELKLETGRTHQIRVHLSELGYPIVADETYGGGGRRAKNLKSLALRQLIESMTRFALHAAELGFVHPKTHEKMIFKSDWPVDLQPLVEHCDFRV